MLRALLAELRSPLEADEMSRKANKLIKVAGLPTSGMLSVYWQGFYCFFVTQNKGGMCTYMYSYKRP